MSDVAAAPTPVASPSPAPSKTAAPVAKASQAAFSAAPSTSAPAAKTLPPPNAKNVLPDDPAPSTPAAEERKARKLKLKVDGNEEEFDLDAASDEEIATQLQMARAARKRMQESADVKKQFASIQEAIKKDPFAALKDPAFGGLDLEALAEQRLAAKYQEQMMSEPEREKAELQRKIQEYETREKDRTETAKRKETEALETRVRQEMETEFIAALEESGLPKNASTVRMMAEVTRDNLMEGIEMTRQQITAEVQGRLREIHQNVTRGLEGDALEKHLGKDVVDKVLRHAVAKAKAARVTPAAPPSNQAIDLEQFPERKRQNFAQARRFFKGVK